MPPKHPEQITAPLPGLALGVIEAYYDASIGERRLNKEWTNVIGAGTLIENQARHD
jgi:hypothetical protein